MFNKLLTMLGLKKDTTTEVVVAEAPYKVEPPEVAPVAEEFEQPPVAVITATSDKKVTKVKEVTVKTTAAPKKEKPKYNKAGLEQLTKAQLEEIGSGEFGLAFTSKTKKPDMVEAILKEQRKTGKK